MIQTPSVARFYVYAVVDKRATPPSLVDVALTRKDGRAVVQGSADAEHLRVRRAKLTLYES